MVVATYSVDYMKYPRSIRSSTRPTRCLKYLATLVTISKKIARASIG